MIFDACFQLHTESRIASHRWHRKGAWAWKISFTSKRTENLINLDKHEFKTTLKRTESGWEFFTGMRWLEWDGALADTNARWQNFMKLKRWKLNALQLANVSQPQWSKLEMHFNSERCFFRFDGKLIFRIESSTDENSCMKALKALLINAVNFGFDDWSGILIWFQKPHK